jgi:hypothetical protein
MQMENIFEINNLQYNYFSMLLDMDYGLYNYIDDNLYDEIHTLSQDLEIALKINANGE